MRLQAFKTRRRPLHQCCKVGVPEEMRNGCAVAATARARQLGRGRCAGGAPHVQQRVRGGRRCSVVQRQQVQRRLLAVQGRGTRGPSQRLRLHAAPGGRAQRQRAVRERVRLQQLLVALATAESVEFPALHSQQSFCIWRNTHGQGYSMLDLVNLGARLVS